VDAVSARAIAARVAEVADEDLRASLTRLGTAVFAEAAKRKAAR
jgi:hypothetical protein